MRPDILPEIYVVSQGLYTSTITETDLFYACIIYIAEGLVIGLCCCVGAHNGVGCVVRLRGAGCVVRLRDAGCVVRLRGVLVRLLVSGCAFSCQVTGVL